MQVDRFRFDVDVEVHVVFCDLGINNLSHTPTGSADFETKDKLCLGNQTKQTKIYCLGLKADAADPQWRSVEGRK